MMQYSASYIHLMQAQIKVCSTITLYIDHYNIIYSTFFVGCVQVLKVKLLYSAGIYMEVYKI